VFFIATLSTVLQLKANYKPWNHRHSTRCQILWCPTVPACN